MWNVSTVLDHIISLPQNSELSLLSLSKKLLALFALVSAQRTQMLANIDITCKYLHFFDDSCVISVMEVLKTNSPKKGLSSNKIVLPKFDKNP